MAVLSPKKQPNLSVSLVTTCWMKYSGLWEGRDYCNVNLTDETQRWGRISAKHANTTNCACIPLGGGATLPEDSPLRQFPVGYASQHAGSDVQPRTRNEPLTGHTQQQPNQLFLHLESLRLSPPLPFSLSVPSTPSSLTTSRSYDCRIL